MNHLAARRWALLPLLLLPVLAAGCRTPALEADTPGAAAGAAASPVEGPAEALLRARITTVDGTVYEGPLRFGGGEEALWNHQFNGFRSRNPWMDDAPRDELPRERHSIEILGITISIPGARYSLRRPFMARFGDIARIDADLRQIHVTLKSGARFDLDRYSADDLADGVFIWDTTHGRVDLDEWKIRSIEFLPAPAASTNAGAGTALLHGTVQTAEGSFSGWIQWDREEALGSDLLEGRGANGDVTLRYDAIASIQRVGADRSLVTLRDGRAMELAGTRNAGLGNRGVYVDDARYGRVLVAWEAFGRIDFSEGGPPLAYQDFVPGQPLAGTVVTRSGRRLTGRLVYDLDESETTETLDAPAAGIDYLIPFRLIASIVPEPGARGATVTLQSGEALALEGSGDLGFQHGGMLVFVAGQPKAVYVPWAEVARVELQAPPSN